MFAYGEATTLFVVALVVLVYHQQTVQFERIIYRDARQNRQQTLSIP